MSAPPETTDLNIATQALLNRHRDWWLRKELLLATSHSPALGALWLPLADGTLADHDVDVRPELLDLDRLAGEPREAGPLERVDDHVRTVAPYERIPWVEAILGAPIRATIQGGSMRGRSIVREWSEWPARAGRLDPDWLGMLTTLTSLLAERAAGRRAVCQTLMRGPSDLAEALLGPEMMCFALYDHPAELERFLDDVTAGFVEILQAQLARIPRIAGGVVSPFGIWAPGTVVRTQCDASAFLSAEHYARWFLPHDVRICQAVDHSIIHLHSRSLHTVDALLEVERPHAIQVTLDPAPSGPPVAELLPVFRKVLGAKPLIVEGKMSDDELKRMLDELPTDGLSITVRVEEW